MDIFGIRKKKAGGPGHFEPVVGGGETPGGATELDREDESDRTSHMPGENAGTQSGPVTIPEDAELEPRRATRAGPQLFSIVVDNSYSMEEGNKATEANRVLRAVLNHLAEKNAVYDQQGTAPYFLAQVVMFAETYDDSTQGLTYPKIADKEDPLFTVRHPKNPGRLGDTTNYEAPLTHVYETLTGKQGITEPRLAAAMPAPIVLFISDGKPNVVSGYDANKPITRSERLELAKKARRLAVNAAEKLKSIKLREASRLHREFERLYYGETNVRLVTIGLGDDQELDQELLESMATVCDYGGPLPLYLHCPNAEQLKVIGTQIVGTFTTADQSATLEELVYRLRHQGGV